MPPSPAPVSPEVQLAEFHQPGIFNYSALLLSEDDDTLYVGAREAVFAVNAFNVSQKQREVWPGAVGLGCRPCSVFFWNRHTWLLLSWSRGLCASWLASHASCVWSAASPPASRRGALSS